MGMGKKNKEEKDNLSWIYTERSSLLDAKCRKANASLQWDQRKICHICTVESDNKKCYCCKWNEIWYSIYRWEKQTFCCVQLPNCLRDALMFSEWKLSKCFMFFFSGFHISGKQLGIFPYSSAVPHVQACDYRLVWISSRKNMEYMADFYIINY